MIGGIIFILGTWPVCSGIWYDRPKPLPEKRGWGIKLGLRWGPMVWGCPKFWSKLWNHDHYPSEEATWFVLTLPFVVGPFVSICLGRVGIYIGMKDSGGVLLPSAKFDPDRDNFNK